ncbi:MAG TPA: hypothetical protein VF459_14410 [Caulobacteraceae bacterium]
MTTIIPATSAVSSAFARYDRASSDLARSAANSQDIATAVASQISAKEAVGASVAVMKTQDEMTKTLLDITV